MVRRKLVILAAAAVVIPLLGSACPTDTPPVLNPVPAISLAPDGTITVPGATIVYQGMEFQESATLPSDALVGIVKDGTAYLYHPSIGAADLSNDTSRRAVGYFIAQRLKEQAGKGRNSSRVGDSIDTSNGLRVTQINDTHYAFENLKKRYAVVNSPAEAAPAFLSPRDPIWGISSNLITTADRIAQALGGTYSPLDRREIMGNAGTLKTYGATVRALPILYATGGAALVLAPGFIEKNRLAYESDPELFMRVNTLDLMTLAMDAVHVLTSAVPLFGDCLDSAFTVGLADAMESGAAAYLGDQAIFAQLSEDTERRLVQSTGGCICTVTPAKPVCETVKTALVIIGGFNWVFDDILLGGFDSLLSDAYAEVPGLGTSNGNHPPIADAGADQVQPSGQPLVHLSAFGSGDPDGDPLSYLWQQTAGSSVTLRNTTNAVADFDAPVTNFAALSLSFRLTVSDGKGGTAQDTMNVLVSPIPVAQPQSVTVQKNTPKAITLTATDADNGPGALTFQIITQTSHGILSGTGPNRTYSPQTDYVGPDIIDFRAGDGVSWSDIVRVSITVIGGPSDDCANAPTVGNGTFTGSNVSANTDGTANCVSGTGADVWWRYTAPVSGTATIDTCGSNFDTVLSVLSSCTGTELACDDDGAPCLGFNSRVTFNVTAGTSYRLRVAGYDNNNTGSIVLNISTGGTNDPPVAEDQSVTVAFNTAKAITLGATDQDGDLLTYSVVSSPTHGMVTSGTTANRTYAPDPTYSGLDSFTFKANDGQVDSNVATVLISVLSEDEPDPHFGRSAMAFDSNRAVIVLFGNSPKETWEFDGSHWTLKDPATVPNVGFWYSMAYDSLREVTVLFGSNSTTEAQTWLWNGTDWTMQSSTEQPQARYGHAMAFDSARGVVVLYGGFPLAATSCQGTPELADTWELDGSSWHEKFPFDNPGSRWQHAMAFDANRQVTVLFGGHVSFGSCFSQDLADTWEWDGINWIQTGSVTAPLARFGHAMAYDLQRNRIVLFGGVASDYNTPPSCFQDTWELVNTIWGQVPSVLRPSSRFYHSMAYDSARNKCVLNGGTATTACNSYDGNTWEWDGSNWSRFP